jgi:hypothetical protein
MPENPSVLIGDSDTSLVNPPGFDLLADPTTPTIVLSPHVPDRGSSSVDEKRSEVAITPLGDSPQKGFSSRRYLPGNQPQGSGKLPAVSIERGIGKGCYQGGGRQNSYPGNAEHPIADLPLLSVNRSDLGVISDDSILQIPKLLQKVGKQGPGPIRHREIPVLQNPRKSFPDHPDGPRKHDPILL